MSGAQKHTHGELHKLNWQTLSDRRAEQVRPETNLYRAAIILTGACNFKCPYCNTLNGKRAPTLKKEDTLQLLEHFVSLGLQELRISGGEPTIVPWLPELVKYAVTNKVRVVISSNGYADIAVYESLVNAGVSEFSISMDSADPVQADLLSGNCKNVLDKIKTTIEYLTKNKVPVYIGMTCGSNKSSSDMKNVVNLAKELGVFEIKIMSLSNEAHVVDTSWITIEDAERFPLLKWRSENYKNGKDVRGLTDKDCTKCAVVLDDITVAGNKHYPCNIYFREGGAAIGELNNMMLAERARWFKQHNSYEDDICRYNCMDILKEYNNRASELNSYIKQEILNNESTKHSRHIVRKL